MSGPLYDGFPTRVRAEPAPAQAGDFCGANPRAVVLGNPGQFQAPTDGIIVGQFCWVNTDSGLASQSYVAGRQIGFLRRCNNAFITAFLGFYAYVVLRGMPLELFAQGDFWGRFAGGATPGHNVFADPSTGALISGAGTTAASASVTASAGAAFTGVIATNVLTASSVTGVIREGSTLVGVGVTPGTLVGAQLTGSPGAAGTYTVTHADLSSVAMTTTIAKLDVTAVGSGVLGAGSLLSGSGVTGGTTIVSQDSGTPGGIGVYTISVAQQFASTTVSESAILTPWKVNSAALAGEVAKISTWG